MTTPCTQKLPDPDHVRPFSQPPTIPRPKTTVENPKTEIQKRANRGEQLRGARSAVRRTVAGSRELSPARAGLDWRGWAPPRWGPCIPGWSQGWGVGGCAYGMRVCGGCRVCGFFRIRFWFLGVGFVNQKKKLLFVFFMYNMLK